MIICISLRIFHILHIQVILHIILHILYTKKMYVHVSHIILHTILHILHIIPSSRAQWRRRGARGYATRLACTRHSCKRQQRSGYPSRAASTASSCNASSFIWFSPEHLQLGQQYGYHVQSIRANGCTFTTNGCQYIYVIFAYSAKNIQNNM
jgi:hypothetical protein